MSSVGVERPILRGRVHGVAGLCRRRTRLGHGNPGGNHRRYQKSKEPGRKPSLLARPRPLDPLRHSPEPISTLLLGYMQEARPELGEIEVGDLFAAIASRTDPVVLDEVIATAMRSSEHAANTSSGRPGSASSGPSASSASGISSSAVEHSAVRGIGLWGQINSASHQNAASRFCTDT
jgi:hypothetical protein